MLEMWKKLFIYYNVRTFARREGYNQALRAMCIICLYILIICQFIKHAPGVQLPCAQAWA